MSKLKDHIDILYLIGLLSILYIPHIFTGGLLLDDLGLLVEAIRFTSYFEFQNFLWNSITMTARPVSAVLHGICYWYFESNAWAFHLINIILFFGSIIIFYLAMKNIVGKNIALLSSLMAIIYPCSSSTIFSSIMMNCNLAAIFWSIALYISTIKIKFKSQLIVVSLILSSLSYEVFIPLFILYPLFNNFIMSYDRLSIKKIYLEILPIIIAITGFGFYRYVIEPFLFDTSFSRIKIFSFPIILKKFYFSLLSGFKIIFYETINISVNAINNFQDISILYLILIVLFACIGIFLYKDILIIGNNSKIIINNITSKKRILPLYNLIIVSLILFIISHLIFVFSVYKPDTVGFENRTLGAIRFSSSILISILFFSIYNILKNKKLKSLFSSMIIGIIILFTISIVGQQKAWAFASDFNNNTIDLMNDIIKEQGFVNKNENLNLVAKLPKIFPQQINQEPILCSPWGLTSLLTLSNPNMKIDANVLCTEAIVSEHKIALDGHGYWEVYYPFWYYDYRKENFFRISSSIDWYKNLN